MTEQVFLRLNGELVELSDQKIRDRLSAEMPDEISVHWVEVNGVRWPVMQAMTIVLGTSPPFRSAATRRHFRRLGFVVGRTMEKSKNAGSSSQAVVSQFDSESAPLLDTVEVSLGFTWRGAGEVTLDKAGYPTFPPLPSVPGLYRFDFGVDTDAKRRWYIGEGKDIRGRADQYRKAKRDRKRLLTSRRLHLLMAEHLGLGGTISISIATEILLGNGTAANLRRKSGRLLGESAAVTLAQLDPNVVVLNRDD